MYHTEKMQENDNVYRTKGFVVSQSITLTVDAYGLPILHSTDTYVARTPELDRSFETKFAFRGERINGTRIPTATHSRRYYYD